MSQLTLNTIQIRIYTIQLLDAFAIVGVNAPGTLVIFLLSMSINQLI